MDRSAAPGKPKVGTWGGLLYAEASTGGCCAVISLAGVSIADPLEDAYLAYERGDYAETLRLMQSPAKRGDAKAQSLLGKIYARKPLAFFDVPHSKAEKVDWLRQAAEEGDAEAQYRLSISFRDGIGAPRDRATDLMKISES